MRTAYRPSATGRADGEIGLLAGLIIQGFEDSIRGILVEFANNKLDAGIHPMVIASASRHAAANLTAFAFRATDDPLDTESIMEDFLRFLRFYDSHHRGEARPMTGLERLVILVERE